LAGYAEVAKYGLIRDAAFFDWCVAHAERLIDGDSDARIYAIRKSCEHKAEIVIADEKETGDRALLNLGHSFGHALEAAFGYDGHTLLHGEAVAIGTVLAFKLSVALGLCPPASAAKVEKHFADTGLPTKPPKGNYDVPELMRQMAKDKKAVGGELTLVLARDIGKSFAMRKVDPATVQKIWQDSLL
jgi:3-dehydroquinate synthase